jgi:hypothetical protein
MTENDAKKRRLLKKLKFYVLYSTLLRLPPPSDSTVYEDAGIEPRIVTTFCQTL